MANFTKRFVFEQLRLPRGQRRRSEHGQAHRDYRPGQHQTLQLHARQFQQMPRLGAGAEQADEEFRRLPGFTLQAALQLNCSLLACGQLPADFLQQLREHLLQGRAIGNRIFQLHLGRHFRRWAVRHNRLGHESQCLVEPLEQLRIESRCHRLARERLQLSNLRQSQFSEQFNYRWR